MTNRNPIAFLSYVRNDDDHDFGGITKFRERLEGEVKMQSGKSFEIFQDRNDIRWGQFWEERILKSLSEVTFLIPVITPSFFLSPACRKEFEVFLKIERTLGTARLILPVYYVTHDDIEEGHSEDPLIQAIKARNWTDWRSFRFKPFEAPDVRSAFADLALGIKDSIRELNAVAEASVAIKTSAPLPPLELSFAKTIPAPKLPPSVIRKSDGTPFHDARKDDYYVYTNEFDEEIAASDLVGSPEELINLQRFMSTHVDALRRAQRKFLQSLNLSSPPSKSVAITLLLDNSGSLRGRGITKFATWSVLIAEVCERLGVKLEILGFTTRAWKGGQTREQWLADGKPFQPGRLNDLRHIIYKTFEEGSGIASANCSIMMREGILKENIDGEAILWGFSRLMKQSADERILFVLSDGAPIDDSTLSVNPGNFLERHLTSVASWIDSMTAIELRAIGLDFKPKAFKHTQQPMHGEVGIPILQRVLEALQ